MTFNELLTDENTYSLFQKTVSPVFSSLFLSIGSIYCSNCVNIEKPLNICLHIFLVHVVFINMFCLVYTQYREFALDKFYLQ